MTRVCLVAAVVAGMVAAVAQRPRELSPEARDIITRIAADPRLTDVKKYADAMRPAASLKQKLMEGPVSDLNEIYGWDLSSDGRWPVERMNDIVFEIVLSRRYDERRFLAALQTGAPFLRKLRQYDCLGRFNSKYQTAVPRTGGLSFAQAETFLYSIAGSPGFDAERVFADLCGGMTRHLDAPAKAPESAAAPTLTTPAAPQPSGPKPTLNRPFIAVAASGVVPLALIVLLMRSIARDLRVKRSP